MDKVEPVCRHCGRCCKIPIDGKLTKDCKYLIRLKGGRTICRIYKTRLGVKTSKTTQCSDRMSDRVLYDYQGCPYNTNKPIINEEGIKIGNEEKQKEKTKEEAKDSTIDNNPVVVDSKDMRTAKKEEKAEVKAAIKKEAIEPPVQQRTELSILNEQYGGLSIDIEILNGKAMEVKNRIAKILEIKQLTQGMQKPVGKVEANK